MSAEQRRGEEKSSFISDSKTEKQVSPILAHTTPPPYTAYTARVSAFLQKAGRSHINSNRQAAAAGHLVSVHCIPVLLRSREKWVKWRGAWMHKKQRIEKKTWERRPWRTEETIWVRDKLYLVSIWQKQARQVLKKFRAEAKVPFNSPLTKYPMALDLTSSLSCPVLFR